MMLRLGIASLAVLVSLLSCRRAPDETAGDAASVRPLFGPVISREVIGGRADDGRGSVWLLGGGETIVQVDTRLGASKRAPIRLANGDACWGLARLDDGSLWTLRGRSTLAQISEDGRIAREIALTEPHFGLYAHGDRLVYQPARFVQSEGLLFAGAPGDPHPQPWSGIQPRRFPALARAAAASLNMVACGATRTSEQPCWFPDETSVALIGAAGQTRRVVLPGLTRVAPEALLTSDGPGRPLRDVFVEQTGAIWALSSGTAPAGAGAGPGGWLLVEYTSAGQRVQVRRLREAVRLILDVNRERVLVLSRAGLVAEVLR